MWGWFVCDEPPEYMLIMPQKTRCPNPSLLSGCDTKMAWCTAFLRRCLDMISLCRMLDAWVNEAIWCGWIRQKGCVILLLWRLLNASNLHFLELEMSYVSSTAGDEWIVPLDRLNRCHSKIFKIRVALEIDDDAWGILDTACSIVYWPFQMTSAKTWFHRQIIMAGSTAVLWSKVVVNANLRVYLCTSLKKWTNAPTRILESGTYPKFYQD